MSILSELQKDKLTEQKKFVLSARRSLAKLLETDIERVEETAVTYDTANHKYTIELAVDGLRFIEKSDELCGKEKFIYKPERFPSPITGRNTLPEQKINQDKEFLWQALEREEKHAANTPASAGEAMVRATAVAAGAAVLLTTLILGASILSDSSLTIFTLMIVAPMLLVLYACVAGQALNTIWPVRYSQLDQARAQGKEIFSDTTQFPDASLTEGEYSTDTSAPIIAVVDR